jgi:hypothetical protein
MNDKRISEGTKLKQRTNKASAISILTAQIQQKNELLQALNKRIKKLEVSERNLKALRAKAIARQAVDSQIIKQKLGKRAKDPKEVNRAMKSERGDAKMQNRLKYAWQLTNFHPKKAYVNGSANEIKKNIKEFENSKNENKNKHYLSSLNRTNVNMIKKYINSGKSEKTLKAIKKDLARNCRILSSKGTKAYDEYSNRIGCSLVNGNFSASAQRSNAQQTARVNSSRNNNTR